MHNIDREKANGPFEIVSEPDRRRAERSVTVYRVVKITREAGEGLARCRNISDTGMMLESSMAISLGEQLLIEVAPGAEVSARVVWTSRNQCGVAFDRPVDAEQLLTANNGQNPSGRGRGHRLGTDIAASISSQGQLYPTTISNISQQGMLITHDGGFKPGLHVKVVLNDGTEKAAVVQWTNDNFAGLFLFDHFSVWELGDLNCVGRIIN